MFSKFIKIILLSIGLSLSFSLCAQAETLDALLRHSSDPMVGNRHGTVTVVEFFDYQCSHCSNMVSTIDNIVKSNPNVRFVFKDSPVRGPESVLAARVAIAANKQGKYYPFYHAVLASTEPLSEESIMRMAEEVGLNMKKLKKDMNHSKINNQIMGNLNLEQALQVPGTPVFYFARTDATDNKDVTYVIGEMSQRAMQAAIQKLS